MSIKPSRRARKTVDIEFKSKNELVITLPRNKDVDIEALLHKHTDLITRKYNEFLSRKKILEGNRILFKGKPYNIEVRKIEQPKEERVTLQGDSLIITVHGRESPAIILKKWLSTQTENLINSVRDRYSEKLEQTPTRIFIQDTKRWGYCRKNGELVFNWQLSTLPEELAEFVILHEYVHLKAFNHQRRFHTKMVSLMPNYLQREKELKEYLALEPNFEFHSWKI